MLANFLILYHFYYHKKEVLEFHYQALKLIKFSYLKSKRIRSVVDKDNII